MYTLECTATEARPKVQMTWLFDESIVQLGDASFVTLTTKGKKNLWDSSINLHFYLEGTSAMITCLAVGESNLQRTNRTIAFLSLGRFFVQLLFFWGMCVTNGNITNEAVGLSCARNIHTFIIT